jgi:hypothetical integral membrane protein (TIGR02206 family)
LPQFSSPHLAALAVLVAVSTASVCTARKNRRVAIYAGYLLALLILAAWAGEYVADGIDGTYSTRYTLPLQLTDAVSAAAIIALLTRRRLAVELLYFWSLSASLQALLTPDLGQNFPSVYYFTYFGYHIGAVVAALTLVFGLQLYPRPNAALKAFGITLIWAAAAAIGDLATKGNYMYLRTKPVHNSLLNAMGPWPWYIASTAALGLVMLLVLQLISDGLRRLDRPGVPAQSAQRALRD